MVTSSPLKPKDKEPIVPRQASAEVEEPNIVDEAPESDVEDGDIEELSSELTNDMKEKQEELSNLKANLGKTRSEETGTFDKITRNRL